MATTVRIAKFIFILCLLAGCLTVPTASPSLPTAPATHTAPPAPLATTPAESLADQLAGLSLTDFFEITWRALTVRSPETIVTLGLTDIYDIGSVALDDISDAYIRETYQLAQIILDALRQYDRAALTAEEQVSYDVYLWYLEDLLAGQEFMYNDYPATFFTVNSVPESLIQFFRDLHPVDSLPDARDYIARLRLVDAKFDQLLRGLQLREEKGIIPPRFATQWALYGTLKSLVSAPANRTPFYSAFAEKVNVLTDASAEEKKTLLEEAETAIEEVVLPAYRKLYDYLRHLEEIGSLKDGVWQFANGEAYYAYLLRHYTTTDMSVAEIHQLGLQELERIHAEMRAIAADLGYSENLTLAQLYDRVATDSGTLRGSAVLDAYQRLISDAGENLDEVFDIRPQAEVVVVSDPYGGYYIAPAYDGSRPGMFFATTGVEQSYAMPTLAYHETIPGHHWQIALAQELKLPAFRMGMGFLGYTEGWALYAERLAWELGWYADDSYGNLGRLQAEAFRAARLVVDTGIHSLGWTFAQAEDFFSQNTGFERGDSVDPQQQIARYIVWPGQSTAYYVGFLKLLELRQRAMEQLGERFDLVAFHRLILENGAVPLEILEVLVDRFIADQLH